MTPEMFKIVYCTSCLGKRRPDVNQFPDELIDYEWKLNLTIKPCFNCLNSTIPPIPIVELR